MTARSGATARPPLTEVETVVREVDAVLQAAVADGAVPCAVVMAADSSGPVYEGAAGPRTAGSPEPVGADSMFRIASMTKMVATVAALQLVERGELDLDAPVSAYCPQFGDLQVLDGFDGATPRLRAPRTPATVRQLVTHTSGLSYWFWNEDIVRWEAVTGTVNVMAGSRAAFTAPLVCDPGTRFEYGINTDWLGQVVEAVSGSGLDDHIAANITSPLGMTTTTFRMDDEQRARSVPVHVQGEDGSWAATPVDWSPSPEWAAGGHGLYSTPRDYLLFQRMLLGRGTVDGTTLLQPATVESAFALAIGDLAFPAMIRTADARSSCDLEVGPGHTWGLGLLLNVGQQPGMRAPYSGAWAGIFNTHFWVDPASGITAALYSQFLPFVTPASMQLYADVERALYAALR